MNPMLSRRSALLLAAASTAGFGQLAFAQQPSRPVKLIVPFPAGGTADILPRILIEKVRGAYPAGIVVENRAGAGGNIGAEFVARSEADGTTFLASPPGPVAINHHLYKSLNFDPVKWVPVTVMATVPNVLNVRKNFPATTLAEFIAYLKANPGKVSYASQGNGSTSHLTAAMFMQLTGTQMVHVPYKGTAPALVDLVGGSVDLFFDNISSSAQFHLGGKTHILAVADQKRSSLLPQVPTFTEAKLPGMVAVTFFSIVAPAGTSAETVAYAHKAFSGALEAADVKQKFAEQGATPAGWSPEQSAQFIRDESVKWGRVIKSASVTPE